MEKHVLVPFHLSSTTSCVNCGRRGYELEDFVPPAGLDQNMRMYSCLPFPLGCGTIFYTIRQGKQDSPPGQIALV